MIQLMHLFIKYKGILVNLLQKNTSEKSLAWQQDMTRTRKCSSHITPQGTSPMHSGEFSVDSLSKLFKVWKAVPHNLNMNQDHLIQPGLKDQQYWIFGATLIFGGTRAIKYQKQLLSQRLWMFVILVKPFYNYYKSHKKE